MTMPSDEYTKAFDKAVADLADRAQRRDILNAEIAGLKETVRVLASRVTLAPDRQKQVAQLLAMLDYATPNLADSIRSLLTRNFPQAMTAIEVRNTLEETGFNFDDFSNPLSACHAALKRMLTDKEVETINKEGKTAYRRFPDYPPVTSGFVEAGLGRLSALKEILAQDEARRKAKGGELAKALKNFKNPKFYGG